MEEITEKEKEFLWRMLINMCVKFADQYNAEGKGLRKSITWKQAIQFDSSIQEFYTIIKKLGVIPDNKF